MRFKPSEFEGREFERARGHELREPVPAPDAARLDDRAERREVEAVHEVFITAVVSSPGVVGSLPLVYFRREKSEARVSQSARVELRVRPRRRRLHEFVEGKRERVPRRQAPRDVPAPPVARKPRV